MSRVINKLVEASGGWEVFLYKTLREVCDGSPCGASDVVDEAREILEAYEETGRKGGPDLIIPTPQKIMDVEKVEKSRVTPVIKTMKTESVEVDDIVEIKLEDFISTLPSRTATQPRRLNRKIRVDSDAGECQGVLSIPANYKLVNSRTITITTEGNLELGRVIDRNGLEGQITGQGVSGYISMSGKYKLVFKNTDLGIGLIHFDVVAIPPKMNKNQFEKALALQNGSTVENLRKSLQSFEKAIASCSCGKEDCYGWRVADKAEIEEAEAQRKGRMATIRNANIMGEVR